HPRGVAECRMGGDVLDPFTVDPDLATVAQAVEIFASCVRPRSLSAHRCCSVSTRTRQMMPLIPLFAATYATPGLYQLIRLNLSDHCISLMVSGSAECLDHVHAAGRLSARSPG